jgi:hypothetical protein
MLNLNHKINNFNDRVEKISPIPKMKKYIIPDKVKEIIVDDKGNVYALKRALVKNLVTMNWQIVDYYIKLEEQK